MRLTAQQRQQIRTTLQQYFGGKSLILLFGSRVDDNARGGDIDLYIEPEIQGVEAIIDARLDAMAELHMTLGDQKIDLIINRRKGPDLPIYRIARETGLPL